MADRLPVTVLSGAPGAGKTTLLTHLRAQADGRRVGVVADFADAEAMARSGQFDCLVAEMPGLEDPLAIAEGFIFEDELASPAAQAVRLDTLATVVDATNFLPSLHDADFLGTGEAGNEEEANSADSADSDRTMADVLIAQVEVADVIVISKADLAGAERVARLQGILHALNPRADLLTASAGVVPAGRLLATGRFDAEATFSGAGWMAALAPAAALTAAPSPDLAETGTFVYRRRRPFHPQRFADLIHTEWLREHGNVLRSRGLFWLASRMAIAGDWSQAGGVCRPAAAGAWWATQDPADWPTEAAERALIEADMLADGQPAPYGDRRQELVLIGEQLDTPALAALLDACLLTDAELAAGPDAWAALPDPFPVWEDAFDEDGDHDDHHHHHHHHDGECDCHDHGGHGH
jgi:G3E family GTPase